MAKPKHRLTRMRSIWELGSRAVARAALIVAVAGLSACQRPSLVDLAQRETTPGHLAGARYGADHALRNRALGHLAQRNPKAAVAVLRRWVSLEPRSAVAWSDLSAALLTLARTSGELGLLLEALETSTRAMAIRPDLDAARNNQITSLQELGLVHEARARLESADSARSLDDSADTPSTVFDWWQQQVAATSGPPTVAELATWLPRAPGLTRRYLEEQVLEAWSQAHRDGQRIDARRYRQSLDSAACLLAMRFGEHTLEDALKALDNHPDAAARAHMAYTSGVTAYEQSSFAEATRHLKAAHRIFMSLGSPFADLAELYLGIMAFRTSPAEAFTRLEALHRRLDAARSPWLAGRTAWLLGTLEGQEGKYRHAFARYEQAAALLRSAGDPALHAFTDTLIAEVLDFLGRPEAWQHRIRALQGLARHGNPRRRLAALQEAINALEREDRLDLSLPFTDELIAHSRRWGNDLARFSASWQKARALVLSGRTDEAERQLSEARALADALGEGVMQDREFGELETVEALLEIERDPATAAVTLNAALAKRRRIHFRYGEERILLWRARARRRSDDVAGAEQDLRQAIDRQTNLAADLPVVERVARLAAARVLFSELVDLQLQQRRHEEAFLSADAMNTLPFQHLRGYRPEGPLSLPALHRALPAQAVLIELFPLDDRLIAFVVDASGLETYNLPVSRKTLERLVTSFIDLLHAEADPQDITDLAATLASYFAPLGLPVGRPLIFVAAPPLTMLPFGALYDADRQRFWIEDHPISVIESARTATLAAARRAVERKHRGRPRTLIVGIDRFIMLDEQWLPKLPHAFDEASRIAAQHAPVDWLRNEEASAEAVLLRLGEARILYWVGHAVYNASDPDGSGFVLVDEQGRGEVLGLRRLAALDSPLELAILSSCSTFTTSNSAPLSIAAAFPGAPDVLATYWPVDDKTAARIGPEVFARALRQPLAHAFRDVLIESWASDMLNHPSSWAAYAVVGGMWSTDRRIAMNKTVSKNADKTE